MNNIDARPIFKIKNGGHRTRFRMRVTSKIAFLGGKITQESMGNVIKMTYLVLKRKFQLIKNINFFTKTVEKYALSIIPYQHAFCL